MPLKPFVLGTKRGLQLLSNSTSSKIKYHFFSGEAGQKIETTKGVKVTGAVGRADHNILIR